MTSKVMDQAGASRRAVLGAGSVLLAAGTSALAGAAEAEPGAPPARPGRTLGGGGWGGNLPGVVNTNR
ncbi:MAG: hypothetical protein ACHP7N_15890, partial [Caulobacterales bacterium]